MNKDYIGDSVYVEIENDMIRLTTENGMGPSNTIYLELFVYDALKNFVDHNEQLSEITTRRMLAIKSATTHNPK